GTAAWRVLDVEVTPYRADEPLRDREAEPDTGAVRTITYPLERLEHPLAIGDRDAGAAVDHPEVDLRCHRARFDAHRLLGSAPCDRVVDEVCHRTLEQRWVGVDARKRLGDVRRDATMTSAITEARECSRHDFLDADPRVMDAQRTRCEPAHVEEVRDEGAEPI